MPNSRMAKSNSAWHVEGLLLLYLRSENKCQDECRSITNVDTNSEAYGRPQRIAGLL